MEAEEILNLIKILLIIFYSITILFSIVIIGCFGIYEKAGQKPSNAFIPIINLFSILEVAEMKVGYGVMFFIPILNLIVMFMLGAKLADLFDAKGGYKTGLTFLPMVYMPMLSFSNMKYKIKDEEYLRIMDNAKDDSPHLLRQNEYNKLNEQEHNDVPNVDSIFKSEWDTKEAPPPYKAQRAELPHKEDEFEIYEMETEISKVQPKPIEAVKPEEVKPEVKQSKSGKFVVDPDELQDSLEVVDL